MGEHLEWACSKCEKKRYDQIHPYTQKIMEIRRLREAGYPFTANSLTLEEWQDLGAYEEIMQERERNQPRPVYLVKLKD